MPVGTDEKSPNKSLFFLAKAQGKGQYSKTENSQIRTSLLQPNIIDETVVPPPFVPTTAKWGPYTWTFFHSLCCNEFLPSTCFGVSEDHGSLNFYFYLAGDRCSSPPHWVSVRGVWSRSSVQTGLPLSPSGNETTPLQCWWRLHGDQNSHPHPGITKSPHTWVSTDPKQRTWSSICVQKQPHRHPPLPLSE